MSQMVFWWIDDDASREAQFRFGIEKSLGIRLNFISVQREEISDKLEEQIERDPSRHRIPDLVIVDHVLDKSSYGLIREGSTVADVIRKKWPDCPVIGVSAGLEKATILDKQTSYEEFYPIVDIAKYYKSIKIIANTFRKLKQHKPHNKSDFLIALKAPEEEIFRMSTILSDDLKEHAGYSDASLVRRLFRWVRHTLQYRPGFLYDRLWTSTIIGIKERSFGKVAKYAEGAKYTGIFSDSRLERWWSFKVKEMLYKRFSEGDNVASWELGRKIPGLGIRDFSTCHVCGRYFPEIVGFTDQTAKTRVQLHLRCSVPHPDYERVLYFEEMRMAKLS